MSESIEEAPESIAATTEVIPSNLTLEDYSNSALSILKGQSLNLNLLETSSSTLSGFPAHQIVYTYTADGLDLKNMQIWTLADDMVYAITYGGTINEFNDSLPVIQNMIDSFQITEIQ
ncbi:MAG: DcrB-related protein [Nitrosopumilus sp.]|nr:DcrB-related protein [Nitrosopumilus sp.]